MADKTLEKLNDLKRKQDRVDDFSADDVRTLVEGIEYAMSHGGTVGVTVTALEDGYKIIITDSEGMAHEATLKNGSDAYEVYKSTVPSGQTPLSKTEWLESLKGGAGEDGADGHNPCLGVFADESSLPTTDVREGDYAYADVTDSTTQTTTSHIFRYDGSAWVDKGEGSPDNQTDFDGGNGPAVGNMKIDDTKLVNPANNALPKATDVMQLAAKLEGVTASEAKASNYLVAGFIACRATGSRVEKHYYANQTRKTAFIPIGISKAVRFLGFKANYDDPIGYVYMNIDNISTFIAGLTNGQDLSSYIVSINSFEKDTNIQESTEPVEILSDNPEGANYIALFYDTDQSSAYCVKDTNFYCYLQSGERVVDMIPHVVNNLKEGGSGKALSAEAGKSLNERLYGVIEEERRSVDIDDVNQYNVNTLITGDVTWRKSTSSLSGDQVVFGTVLGCKKIEVVTVNSTINIYDYARKVLFTKKALPTAKGDYTFDTLKEGGYLCERYNNATDVDNLIFGTTNVFDVPSDAKYVYVTKRRSSHTLISSLTIIKEVVAGGDINELKSKVSGEEADDVPADLGTAMAVKKAYELINLPYRLRADLPTAFGGNYTDVHVGDIPPSILYSSSRKMQTFVPNAVSIETFLSAISDPNSVQYTETSGIDEGWSKLYYGIVCGMFVEYCLGIKTMINLNYSIFSTPGFELVETQDAQAMRIGYVLNDAYNGHAHCLICVGVRRKKGSGEVTRITLAESLYNDGNTPICQATDYTPTEFNAMLASYHPTAAKAYTILRYTRMQKNTYDGSLVKKYIINKNLLPKKGNKAMYGVGERVVINLLDTTGYTHYKLWKDGEPVDTVALGSGSTINLGTLGYGKYKMVLNGNAGNSLPIEWIVVDYSVSCELVDDGQNDKVKIYFASKNARPLSAHWANYQGNGNGMLSVNFELSDEDIDNGYVITQLSQVPNCVNGLQRYTSSGSDYAVFHDAYAGGREVRPRVIFVTEFGLFTSPTPNSGVLIYQTQG